MNLKPFIGDRPETIPAKKINPPVPAPATPPQVPKPAPAQQPK
jgi:hypothetical protein